MYLALIFGTGCWFYMANLSDSVCCIGLITTLSWGEVSRTGPLAEVSSLCRSHHTVVGQGVQLNTRHTWQCGMFSPCWVMKHRDFIRRDLGLPVVAVAGQLSSVPLATETLDGLIFLILSSPCPK